MAGRMGNDQVTVKNLEVVEVDDKNNILYIKGAIPGSRNALVKIMAPGEMKLAQVVEPAVKESSSAKASEDKEKEVNKVETPVEAKEVSETK